MSEVKREYYIVRVTFHQVIKSFNGSVLTKEDDTGVLTIVGGDYSGYPACVSAPSDSVSGHRFKKPPSMSEVMKWDGMPWYYRIKTADVVKVNEVEVRKFEQKTKSLGAPQ